MSTFSCTHKNFQFPTSLSFSLITCCGDAPTPEPMQFDPWFFFYFFPLIISLSYYLILLSPLYFHLFAIDSHDHDCAWMKKMGTIADKLLFSLEKRDRLFSPKPHWFGYFNIAWQSSEWDEIIKCGWCVNNVKKKKKQSGKIDTHFKNWLMPLWGNKITFILKDCLKEN